MVIIPGASFEDGFRLAERLRLVIEETVFETQKGIIRATVSAGVASIDYTMVNIEDLIKAADDALYRAKSRAKNSVKIAISL